MAFVTIRIKGAEGYTRSALSKDRMVVGRSSDCDLPIKHTSISREHAAFVRDADDWYIEDIGSSNGTLVGSTKLTGRTKLSERDIVKVGRARLTFHLTDIKEAHAAVEVDDDDLGLIDDDDDDGEGGAGGSGPLGPVPEAMKCNDCGTWMSTAHRSRGAKMPCPRCGHSCAVTQ